MEKIVDVITWQIQIKAFLCLILFGITVVIFTDKQFICSCWYKLTGIKKKRELKELFVESFVNLGTYYTGTRKHFFDLFSDQLQDQERIAGVAVLNRFGIITAAFNRNKHTDLMIYLAMTLSEHKLKINQEFDTYGFMTTHGRYLDRVKAKIVAREAKQLLPNSGIFKELISEEINHDA